MKLQAIRGMRKLKGRLLLRIKEEPPVAATTGGLFCVSHLH